MAHSFKDFGSDREIFFKVLEGESVLEALTRKVKRVYGTSCYIFLNSGVKGRFDVVKEGDVQASCFSWDIVR